MSLKGFLFDPDADPDPCLPAEQGAENVDRNKKITTDAEGEESQSAVKNWLT